MRPKYPHTCKNLYKHQAKITAFEMFLNKLEELLVPLEHDQEILFYPIIQKQCYKTSGFKDNLNIKDFIKITFRVKIMYYICMQSYHEIPIKQFQNNIGWVFNYLIRMPIYWNTFQDHHLIPSRIQFLVYCLRCCASDAKR